MSGHFAFNVLLSFKIGYPIIETLFLECMADDMSVSSRENLLIGMWILLEMKQAEMKLTVVGLCCSFIDLTLSLSLLSYRVISVEMKFLFNENTL